MALGGFFKTPGHKNFDYKPRFYDPDKEALEKRLRNSEPLDASDPEVIKARISGAFQRGGLYGSETYRSQRNKQNKQSNVRLLIILGVLIALVFLLTDVYLPQIIDGLSASPNR